MSKVELSAVERKILNLIQQDIPLEREPFRILSKRLGIREKELFDRIKGLKARGIIRNFAAGVNHKALGFKSSLVGLKVPAERLDRIVKGIVKYNEVTHCFLRENDYNLWLVVIYKRGMLGRFLKRLKSELGSKNVMNLPTKRQYKLKTKIKI